MARATDSLEPKQPPESISRVEKSAQLLLAGIHEAFNDSDDERFLGTVRRLKETPGTLESAIDLYESRPDDSGFRWGVIYVASRIGSSGTAEWLTRIALEELPDRTESEVECETSRDGEVLVRIMATEGLGSLVDVDDRHVISDALTTIITDQPDPAVVSAAVVQLLRVDPAAAPRIRRVLPEEHKHFADVELKSDPTEVDRRPESLGLDPGESPLPPLLGKQGA